MPPSKVYKRLIKSMISTSLFEKLSFESRYRFFYACSNYKEIRCDLTGTLATYLTQEFLFRRETGQIRKTKVQDFERFLIKIFICRPVSFTFLYSVMYKKNTCKFLSIRET